MKDPKVQTAVDRLRELFSEINIINEYLHEEGVHYSIKEKTDPTPGPRKFEIQYLHQSVKY